MSDAGAPAVAIALAPKPRVTCLHLGSLPPGLLLSSARFVLEVRIAAAQRQELLRQFASVPNGGGPLVSPAEIAQEMVDFVITAATFEPLPVAPAGVPAQPDAVYFAMRVKQNARGWWKHPENASTIAIWLMLPVQLTLWVLADAPGS